MPTPINVLDRALLATSAVTLTIPIRGQNAEFVVAGLIYQDYTLHFAGTDHPTRVEKIERIVIDDDLSATEAFVVTLVPDTTELLAKVRVSVTANSDGLERGLKTSEGDSDD